MLSKTKAEMKRNLKAALEDLNGDSELVRKFLGEQDCKYIEGSVSLVVDRSPWGILLTNEAIIQSLRS